MKALLKVLSVELVEGFLPMYHREYSASGNPTKTIAKCLKINGVIEDIGSVVFFTPSVLIKTSYGLNSEFTNIDDNSWISYSEKTQTSNSTDTLPCYVKFGKEIYPKINKEDVINISFSIKKAYGKTTSLNRVKILK